MIKVVWQLAESNAIHDRELKEQEDAKKKYVPLMINIQRKQERRKSILYLLWDVR